MYMTGAWLYPRQTARIMQSTRDHRSTLGVERQQGVPLLVLDQWRQKQYESGGPRRLRERESITWRGNAPGYPGQKVRWRRPL